MLITGLVVLAVALWLVWHVGLPLVGSLTRRARKAKGLTPHPGLPPNLAGPFTHGAPDREVSALEMVPGTGDPKFDEIVAADPLLAKLARKTRA